MSDKQVPLTREGRARLEGELVQLRIQRRAVSERLHNAQEQGTSQNDAEYDDAKQEQGMVEGRILEVEDILRRAVTIDTSAHTGRVTIGSTIDVEQDGKHRHFQIVGAPEADPSNGRISNESPVGSALLGHLQGETVDVHTPKGGIKVKILNIE